MAARTFGTHPYRFVYDPRPIWRALRAGRLDLVDIHEEPASLAAAEVRWCLARLAGCRAPFPASTLRPEHRQALTCRSRSGGSSRATLRRAAGVHTCNTEAGRILRRKGFQRPASGDLGLGVDVGDRFAPGTDIDWRVEAEAGAGRRAGADGPERAPVLRRRRRRVGCDLRVGYVGRLESHKGVDRLVAAVAETPGVELEVVGDGPERARLEALSTSSGVTRRVGFAGFSEQGELADVYRRFDAVVAVPSLVTPSWIEQFGRVAVEAMASGVVVVASRSGALPEVVGDAGLLVEPGDTAALAKALGELRDDPVGRARRAEAGADPGGGVLVGRGGGSTARLLPPARLVRRPMSPTTVDVVVVSPQLVGAPGRGSRLAPGRGRRRRGGQRLGRRLRGRGSAIGRDGGGQPRERRFRQRRQPRRPCRFGRARPVPQPRRAVLGRDACARAPGRGVARVLRGGRRGARPKRDLPDGTRPAAGVALPLGRAGRGSKALGLGRPGRRRERRAATGPSSSAPVSSFDAIGSRPSAGSTSASGSTARRPTSVVVCSTPAARRACCPTRRRDTSVGPARPGSSRSSSSTSNGEPSTSCSSTRSRRCGRCGWPRASAPLSAPSRPVIRSDVATTAPGWPDLASGLQVTTRRFGAVLDSPGDPSAEGAGLVVVSLEAWDEVWRRRPVLRARSCFREIDPNRRVLFVEPAFDVVHERRHPTGRRRRPGLRPVDGEGRVVRFEPVKVWPRRLGPIADRSLVRQIQGAADQAGLRRSGSVDQRSGVRRARHRPRAGRDDLRHHRRLDRGRRPDPGAGTRAAQRGPAVRRERIGGGVLGGSGVHPARGASRPRRRPQRRRRRPPDPAPTPSRRPARRADGRLRRLAARGPAGRRPRRRPGSSAARSVRRARRPQLVVPVDPSAPGVGPERRAPRRSPWYADVPRLPAARGRGARPSRTVTPFTESLDPIKAYECVALGRPTVSTPVAGFRDLGGRIVSVDRGQFVAAVARVRDETPDSDPRPVVSWRDRAEAFACQIDAARTGPGSRTRTARRPLRVVYVDHCAQLSGGELALLRLLTALEHVDAHVVLGEHGPPRSTVACRRCDRPRCSSWTERASALLRSIG